MTIAAQMVEAAARELAERHGEDWAELNYSGRQRWRDDARASLGAAHALAETEGAGVYVVPGEMVDMTMHQMTRDGWNACRVTFLAGRVWP